MTPSSRLGALLLLALTGVAAGGPTQPAAGRTVVGILIDDGGAPVAGGQVQLGEESTVSGQDGLFRFEYPRLQDPIRLRMEAPGFARRQLLLPKLPARALFDIGVFRLSRGAAVTGTVVDPGGRPLEGAQVFLTTEAGYMVTSSDERGHFRFERVHPDRYDLLIHSEGMALGAWQGKWIGVPAASEEATTSEPVSLGELALEPGATLTGRVETRDRVPLPGALVEISHSTDEPHWFRRLESRIERHARTDEAGDFHLQGLTPGTTASLEVKAPGWRRAVGYRGYSIPMGAEPASIGTLLVEPAGSIVGRIADPAGNPIEGAQIYPRADGGRRGPLRRVAESDSDGRFRLDGLALAAYRLEVLALGFETQWVRTPPSSEPLEIVCRPVSSGRLEISVRSTHGGAGAAEATIRIQGLHGLGQDFNRSVKLGHPGQEAWNRISWDRLPVGAYSVAVLSDNSAPLVTETVQVAHGTNRLSIDLPPSAATATVEGRLIDADDQPVAFAWIGLDRQDGRGPGAHTLSDGHGRWRAAVHPGLYSVSVDSREHLDLYVEGAKLGLGSTDLGVWRLDRGRTLRGRLIGLSPGEMSRLTISAQSGYESAPAEVDSRGRYRVTQLTAGRWSLHAEVSGSPLRAEGVVLVEEGADLPRFDLTFTPALAVRGRVTNRGTPLINASIRAEPRDPGVFSGASTHTDAAGHFELTGLAAGRHGLVVSDLGTGRIHGRTIEVPTEGEIEIHLATARASGRVIRADDGAPLAEVHVRFDPIEHDQPDENGVTYWVSHQYFGGFETDVSGAFDVGPLEEGLWRASVDVEGFLPTAVEFTIADGVDVAGLVIAVASTPGLRLDISVDGGGKPGSVQISLQDAQGKEIAQTFLQPRGTEELHWSQAPPGDWSLVVSNDLVGACVRQQVSIPGPTARVVLPSLGALHLTVVELLQDEMAAELELLDADGQLFARRSILGTRRFYVWRIPPGLYEVRVDAADGRSWGQWLGIDADRLTEATLD